MVAVVTAKRSLQGIKAILRRPLGRVAISGQSSAIWWVKRKVGTKDGLLVNKHRLTATFICIGQLPRPILGMMMIMFIMMAMIMFIMMVEVNKTLGQIMTMMKTKTM